MFTRLAFDCDRRRRLGLAAFGLRRSSRDLGNVLLSRLRGRCPGAGHMRLGRRLGCEGRRCRRAALLHLCLRLLLLLLLLGGLVAVGDSWHTVREHSLLVLGVVDRRSGHVRDPRVRALRCHVWHAASIVAGNRSRANSLRRVAALVRVRVRVWLSWENSAIGNGRRGRRSMMAMNLRRELMLLARETLGHHVMLQVLVP